MRHQVKKIKFKLGDDYGKMNIRKLANNFITYGKLTTTKTRAKYLKPYIERIISKAKVEKESNKNYLKAKLSNEKTVKTIFTEIVPKFEKKLSGFIRITNLPQRISDGAEMVRVEWTFPEVQKEEIKTVKK